jgi:hypothetical protein
MHGSAESRLGGVLYMGKSRPLSHVHEREYWGELDAGPLCQWLNRKDRPAKEPIEKLVRLNSELGTPMRDVAREIQSIVGALVRRFKVAVAPVVRSVTTQSWEISWGLVGKMAPAQGLALVKVLHLADKGLLMRVRKCAWQECGRWYFARFQHQEFCSGRCQQRAARSTQEWKDKRKAYMKRLRRETKLREQKWLRISEAKRKGKS